MTSRQPNPTKLNQPTTLKHKCANPHTRTDYTHRLTHRLVLGPGPPSKKTIPLKRLGTIPKTVTPSRSPSPKFPLPFQGRIASSVLGVSRAELRHVVTSKINAVPSRAPIVYPSSSKRCPESPFGSNWLLTQVSSRLDTAIGLSAWFLPDVPARSTEFRAFALRRRRYRPR